MPRSRCQYRNEMRDRFLDPAKPNQTTSSGFKMSNLIANIEDETKKKKVEEDKEVLTEKIQEVSDLD